MPKLDFDKLLSCPLEMNDRTGTKLIILKYKHCVSLNLGLVFVLMYVYSDIHCFRFERCACIYMNIICCYILNTSAEIKGRYSTIKICMLKIHYNNTYVQSTILSRGYEKKNILCLVYFFFEVTYGFPRYLSSAFRKIKDKKYVVKEAFIRNRNVVRAIFRVKWFLFCINCRRLSHSRMYLMKSIMTISKSPLCFDAIEKLYEFFKHSYFRYRYCCLQLFHRQWRNKIVFFSLRIVHFSVCISALKENCIIQKVFKQGF